MIVRLPTTTHFHQMHLSYKSNNPCWYDCSWKDCDFYRIRNCCYFKWDFYINNKPGTFTCTGKLINDSFLNFKSEKLRECGIQLTNTNMIEWNGSFQNFFFRIGRNFDSIWWVHFLSTKVVRINSLINSYNSIFSFWSLRLSSHRKATQQNFYERN